MIERYTRKEMGELWEEPAKKQRWLNVELAVLRAKGELHLIPAGISDAVIGIVVTPEILARADEIEKTTDHDLIAFVMAVTEKLPPEVHPYFHEGCTSYDIEDTAQALALVHSLTLLQEECVYLHDTILKRANEHRKTLMVGRTHGIHAEPITFGLKLLNWADVMSSHIERIEALKKEVAVGKISGAVGVYTMDPRVEELACEQLGLVPARTSTQIISRDLIFRYISTLVGVANSLDRFATEICNLARTDIGEVAEFKKPGAKGSSAMPGKSRLRNPIKSENVRGLARMMRAYLIPAAECEVVWHERTLENSAPERIFLPDASILLDFMLHRFSEVTDKLVVYPKRMKRNMEMTGGIVYAQQVMLALTAKGMPRHEAYELLENLALKTDPETYHAELGRGLKSGFYNFHELVRRDKTIDRLLPYPSDEIEACFNPWNGLRHLDAIFARFGL